MEKELYKQVEPQVELIGRTVMREKCIVDNPGSQVVEPDAIPGHTARMSYQSTGTPDKDVKLTKSLLNMKPVAHTGPFENMQWVWRITGISKSCMTQFDRHRIGMGFVQMSGRYMNRNQTGFIYNTYDYLDEDIAKDLLKDESALNETAMNIYNYAITKGATKQDARKSLPVSFATGTIVHMNSQSMRNFFKLRLDSHAEWEIRRMANMMLEKAMKVAPAHFGDIM